MPKGLNALLSPLGPKQLCVPEALPDPEGTIVPERIVVSGQAQSTGWQQVCLSADLPTSCFSTCLPPTPVLRTWNLHFEGSSRGGPLTCPLSPEEMGRILFYM